MKGGKVMNLYARISNSVLVTAMMVVFIAAFSVASINPLWSRTLPNIEGTWEGSRLCGALSSNVTLNISRAGDGTYSAKFGYPFFRTADFSISARGRLTHKKRKNARIVKKYLGNTTLKVRHSKTFQRKIITIVNRYKSCRGMILFHKSSPKLFGAESQNGLCSRLRSWHRNANYYSSNIKKMLDTRNISFDDKKSVANALFSDSVFRRSFKTTFDQLSTEQRTTFNARALECYLFDTLYWRVRDVVEVLFEPSFLKKWDTVRKSDQLKLMNFPDLELKNYYRASAPAKPFYKQFKSELSSVLLGISAPLSERSISSFLQRWSGKFESLPPAPLDGILEMLSYPKNLGSRISLRKASHLLFEKYDLPNKPNPYAAAKSVKQVKYTNFEPRDNEYILASHFGVRHFVKENLDCKRPVIRTVALAKIPPSAHTHAYFAAIQGIRSYCGTYRGLYGKRPAAIGIIVDFYVGKAKYAVFRLVEGGTTSRSTPLVRTKNFKIVSSTLVSDAVAEVYWNAPGSALRIDRQIINNSAGPLRNELHYIYAVDGRTNFGKIQDVAYDNYRFSTLDGAPYVENMSLNVKDQRHFAEAIKGKHPAALNVAFGTDPKVDLFYFRSPSAYIKKYGMAKYLQVLWTLYARKSFAYLGNIRKLGKLGISIEVDEAKNSLRYKSMDQPPTVHQTTVAIRALLKRSNCQYFPYLWAEHANLNKQRFEKIAKTLWRWRKTGCETGFEFGSIGLSVSNATPVSCVKDGSAYKCRIKVRYNCRGTGALKGDSIMSLVCPYFKIFEVNRSNWIFTHASGQGESQMFNWDASPAK